MNVKPSNVLGWRNAITYCSLHNDSTVDISRNGKIIVSFRELASGCYLIGLYDDRTIPSLILKILNSSF